jgi:hypothetical protein
MNRSQTLLVISSCAPTPGTRNRRMLHFATTSIASFVTSWGLRRRARWAHVPTQDLTVGGVMGCNPCLHARKQTSLACMPYYMCVMLCDLATRYSGPVSALRSDRLVSNFTFNVSLRLYIMGRVPTSRQCPLGRASSRRRTRSARYGGACCNPCLQARKKASLVCMTYCPRVMLCDLTKCCSIQSAWFQRKRIPYSYDKPL